MPNVYYLRVAVGWEYGCSLVGYLFPCVPRGCDQGVSWAAVSSRGWTEGRCTSKLMDMLVGRIPFLAGCWPEASPIIPCHMSLSTGSSPRGNLHSSEWARKWEKAWKPEATVSSWPSLRSHISDLLLFSIHENFPQILAHDCHFSREIWSESI